MKTFKQFQEQIKTGGTVKKPTVIMPDGKELPGLGGGGGGTNSITDKSPAKSFKKRVGDVAKILTFPLHKKRVDPTEKFATEGAMAIPAAAGVVSKVLPAAVATYGAVKTLKDTLPTFMQIKNPKRSVYTGTRKSQKKERIPTKSTDKTADIAREKGLDLTDPRQRMKASSLAKKTKKTNKTNKKINPKTGDFVKPRYDTKLKGIRVDAKKGEAKATEKLIDKINNPTYLEKVRRNVRKEEVMAAPTNSTGPAVPGTGDDSSTVVVREKKPPMLKRKTYAKGGIKSRKPWLDYLKNK